MEGEKAKVAAFPSSWFLQELRVSFEKFLVTCQINSGWFVCIRIVSRDILNQSKL